ncbi:conserved membrane hypothetical protein [Hyphomicrobiales bacterium]|nr:conserved membrane hypothetical protein [Hyphomicrobiales bacterium]CAH1693041.1 conserved membrane hypothetical protein [Hyphomicrobiales bacterium]
MSGRALLMLGACFTVWAVAFVLLYAMLSVGCRFGWESVEIVAGISLQRAQLVAIFLLHLAACVALTLGICEPKRSSFLRTTARWGAMAATGAIAFVFLPVFALSTCD